MTETFIAGFNFDVYGRLFARAAGEHSILAVCDRQWVPVWTTAGRGREQLEKALVLVRQTPGLESAEWMGGARPVELDDFKGLQVFPIRSRDEGVGWVASFPPGNTGAAAEGCIGVGEVLQDIAASIGLEYELSGDLESMTKELSDCYEELHLIFGMGRIANSYGTDGVFRQLIKLCTDFLEVDLAVFHRLDETKPLLVNYRSEHCDKLDPILSQIQNELLDFITINHEVVIINDATDTRRSQLFNCVNHKLMAFPILLEYALRGILALTRTVDSPDFDSGEARLMKVLSDQIVILIQNQDMHRDLEQFNAQLVATLIEAVDAKDPYTRGHSERVNQYAMEIGRSFDLGQEQLQFLFWASLLHDMGKVAISDQILCKPGKLEEDEMQLIRAHSEKGYLILSPNKRLAAVMPGIRHHHERYDGNGYPHGLSGEEIPLLARIIAVADTYDAMTSSRAYRPARSHDEAMDELRRVAGSQLDPQVVSTWCRMVKTDRGFLTPREVKEPT